MSLIPAKIRLSVIIHVDVFCDDDETRSQKQAQITANLLGLASGITNTPERVVALTKRTMVRASHIQIVDRAEGHLEFVRNTQKLGI